MERKTWKIASETMQALCQTRVERICRAGETPVVTFTSTSGQKYHFHGQCPLRLTWDGIVRLSVNDMFLPREGVGEEDSDAEAEGRSRYDECAESLEKQGLVVKRVTVSPYGGLELFFDNGARMTVFTLGANEDEEWRLIDAGHKRHWVYHGNGSFGTES